MSTKNQPQKINNNCWADDRLCLRRRPHPAENGRIHRNRKANIGPDILAMKVDKFIDGGEEIMAPLSMNRKKRWELLEAKEMPQRPERGIRVTKVIQRINPFGKGQMAGRDIFDEENVMEICSKGGNGKLIKKSCGSGRGVNKLAQLFQENDRPKKRRNLRKGRGLDESQMEIMDEGKPIWIDLFGSNEHEGGQKKKAKKSGRNRAEEKEELAEFEQKMHFYYTIKCQMATKHQSNSGWQQREEQMTMQEKKYMKRSILGRKCQLKMDQENFDEEFENSDTENEEEEFEVYQPKIVQKENKRISREFISKNVESIAQKRPKNWWLNQIGQNEGKIDEEKEEELKEMNWKLDEKQIGQLNGLEIDKMNLPNGMAIYEWEKLKGIFKNEIEGQIPDGSLLIRRNGRQRIRWVINLAQNEKNDLMEEEGTSSENYQKKRHILDLTIQSKLDRKTNQKIRKYLRQLDTAPISHQKQSINANENSAEFFPELLRTRDKTHRLDMKLLENEAFTEEEATQKALALFFEEHKKSIRKWQKGRNPLRDSAFGSEEESNSETENCTNFCEVCFAECNDLTEGFGLPECKEGTILGDEHLFCNGCWRKHIKQCLADGKVPIGCMEPRCPSILHPDCALLFVGQSNAEIYRRLLSERRKMHSDFLHCPKCDQLNFVKELDADAFSNQLTICSNCAETTCVKCGRRQHLPLNCMERDLYEHILRANGQSLDQLVPEEGPNVASGVRCTKCRNLVEKNQGCDHMTCRCGHQFCWRCGQDWLNHWQCQIEGQITIPLFDNHIFLNPKTGLRFRRMPKHIQVLAKFPEKFLNEYAKIRAPRERNGVKLFLEMEKAFTGNVEEAGKWTVKYMQLSEFVELALVKSKLATKNDQLKKSGERLLLNFTSLLIMANLMIEEGERERNDRMEISREMIENGYTEMLALCRQMIK